MSFSPLDRLERTALSIVVKNGSMLDLTNLSDIASFPIPLKEPFVTEGSDVLVVGPLDTNLMQRIAWEAGKNGQITVNEFKEENCLEIEHFVSEHGLTNCRLLNSEYGDFRTKLEFVNDYLSENILSDMVAYKKFKHVLTEQRQNEPVVQNDSIDTVFLNGTLNLREKTTGQEILSEAFRVLRRAGKVILTIVLTDEELNHDEFPLTINNLKIESILREKEIYEMMESSGFYGMSVVWRETLPCKIVAGNELRTFVIEAYKGKQGICLDQGHAVIYKGPWSEVIDDDGHRFPRGERMAVCAKTYEIMTREPYSQFFIGVPPYLEVPLDQAPLFDCNTPLVREPAVTKGKKSVFDTIGDSCDSSTGCC